ncbi:MAG: PKD domain-containing protein [Candidatus Nealsonbacteria bacterium]|nr:PKD domain-containing protein [Candidatus Nealsonbacteria bacterium]
MVKTGFNKQRGDLFKKCFLLGIILFMIPYFLFYHSPALEAKVEIKEEDVKRIKDGLDLMKALANFTLIEDKIKDILNIAISFGETSTDVTYGLLILSSLNEMDLLDLVVSQRYKQEARNYFNAILDERLNLINYYTKVVYDIPKALQGQITGPLSSLTLNTFSVTNDILDIFISFENIRTVKLYDGLWYYFDLRKGHEPHKTAWEEAKMVMGWAAFSNPFRFREEQRKEELRMLESQFDTLFAKWSQHIVINQGVKEAVKEGIREELRDSLSFAIKKYDLLQEEDESSLVDRMKSSWSIVVASLKEAGGYLFTGADENTENTQPEEEASQAKDTDYQEIIDDLLEENDALSQTLRELEEEKDQKDKENKELTEKVALLEGQIEAEQQKRTLEEETEIQEEQEEEKEEEFSPPVEKEKITLVCEKEDSLLPARDKIIINEVAWMGTEDNSADEWVELKNVSGQEINLEGWRLMNQEEEIKIVFTSQHFLSPSGFFLLERTDDNSVPHLEADIIYTGSLKNTGDNLYLFDENCTLQDRIFALSSWPAGNNSTKKTMERKENMKWQTSQSAGGTPKGENSTGHAEDSYSGDGGGSGGTSSPSPAPYFSPGVLVNEIQLADGSSSKHDFVEIFNPKLESQNLSGCQLKKKSNSGKEYSIVVFSEDDVIPPQDYLLWVNSSFSENHTFSTKIATTTQTISKNNSLALFDKEDNIIDAVAWGSSSNPFVEGSPFAQNPDIGLSLGRRWSSSSENYSDTDNNLVDFEIQSPTPGKKNKAIAITTTTENQKPVASFVYTPEQPIVDQTIIFSATSSYDLDGVIIEFSWNFGDGFSTTTTSPTTTHSFSTSSNFIVELSVKDNYLATSSIASTSVNVLRPGEEAPLLKVVVNEIAWMGTGANSSDEWIELYNNSPYDIDLLDWNLSWGHEENSFSVSITTSSATTTIIAGEGFYLIERSDDQTIQDIQADWIGAFASSLNNQGEKLELRDRDGRLMDSIDCQEGWFAGKASPGYVSMERVDSHASGTNPNNWANNNLISRNGLDYQGNQIFGTPKQENSVSKSETWIRQSGDLPFDKFDEIVLGILGSPYLIDGNAPDTLSIPSGKTLGIEERVTLKFGANEIFYVEGTLKAIGNEDGKISLTSLNDNTIWAGIGLRGSSSQETTPSRLEFFKIENAERCWGISCSQKIIISAYDKNIVFKNGEISSQIEPPPMGVWLEDSTSTLENITFQYLDAALNIKNGQSEIKNCSFRENSRGIYIVKDAKVNVTNNTFSRNSQPAYFVNAFPSFSGNSASENEYNGFFMGNVAATTTLKADLPYIVQGTTIPTGATLILEPGVIIKIENQGINVYGRILSQGETSHPVLFTSIHDDAEGGDTNNNGDDSLPHRGDWGNIHFYSPGSVLDNTTIKYGGKENPAIGALTLEKDVIPTILNSLIEKNMYAMSFPSGTTCETIQQILENLQVQGTVFQDNKHLTYPRCE